MAGNELRNQELSRHEEQVDRNIEHNQAVNLGEKRRGVAAANQNSTIARIVNIVYFLFGALELLLAVRVILYLIGVNAENGFASFIYGLSAPFVALFASLLQNPTLGGTSVLEITTLIAMLVYAILAWLVGRVIWLTLSRSR
ncbi:MAG: YggT family protein [Pirellulales bacterium]|nr:YggT family protein [Pirellulales bacterium]